MTKAARPTAGSKPTVTHRVVRLAEADAFAEALYAKHHLDAPGIAVLKAYGVEGGLAASYTLVLHVALWLPITVLGLYYFGKESLSWSTLEADMAEVREEQTAAS